MSSTQPVSHHDGPNLSRQRLDDDMAAGNMRPSIEIPVAPSITASTTRSGFSSSIGSDGGPATNTTSRATAASTAAVIPKIKQPSWLKKIMTKLGLNVQTLKLMFKASLPPVIATAMILSPAVSSYFTTIGYEVAVVSVLALAILPRGKFLQTLMLNMAAVFLGGGLSMLVLWCGIQARLHTMADPLTPINPPPSDDPAPSMSRTRPTRLPYSSSQSAVCGVLLFFNTWLINIARAKIPSFNTPAILFSILINVAAMQGPLIGDTYQAWLLVERLAAAMLTALALGTCVSLFVFPVTSRGGVLKQFGGGVGLLRKAVRLQGEYLQGLEGEDMFALRLVETSVAGGGGGHKVQADKDKKKKKRDKLKDDEFDDDDRPLTKEEETALELKRTIVELRNLVGKVQGDMGFAKREVAWGKLDAHNLGEIYKLFRAMFIPIMGMATVMDIFRRTAKERGWTADEMEDASAELLSEKNEERKVWNGLMKRLHEPFAILSEAIDEGLEHAAVQLGILPKPKDWGRAKMERLHAVVTGSSGRSQKLCDPDVEAQRQRRPSLPGESGFGRVLEDKIQRFYSCKGETLRYWANENGLSYEQARDGKTWDLGSPATRERRQNQLYILLYMEQLMLATGEAVHDFVQFADARVADGTMSSSRLLYPGLRSTRKWISGIFNYGPDSGSGEQPTTTNVMDRSASKSVTVHLGEGYSRTKRDPEHLPPTTAIERMGDRVRAFGNLLSSDASTYGLRVSCATMTIAIVGLLERTQWFFQEQRLVWAMIIVAMSMTQTSGQSIFGFLCRIIGSLVAMASSLIAWYMAKEKTPGVLVLMWLFIFIDYYFFIKYPQIIPAVIVCIISQVLIIGYEFQVQVIGLEVSERMGQPYYPTYLIAPYRVATVAAGCLVAFFWTIFPSPFTDRTWLRRDLSATLYLLANYFSAISQTVRLQLAEEDEVVKTHAGPHSDKQTPAHHLARVRHKIFGKLMILLPSLGTHAQWQRWEPSIGGRFPEEVYEEIILRSSRILNYLTLMSYTATRSPHTFTTQEARDDEVDAEWTRTLRRLLDEVQPAHYSIVSTLALLSNSLLSGQALPPFVHMPPLYGAGTPSDGPQSRHNSFGGYLHHRPPPLATAAAAVAAAAGGEYDKHCDCHNLSDLLDPKNVNRKGYTEYSVMQVCSSLVRDDLQGLVRAVEGLVGVVDFSFRIDGLSDGGPGAASAKKGVDGNGSGSDRSGSDTSDEGDSLRQRRTYTNTLTREGTGGPMAP
ncbi:hypothetical protein MCOR29_010754 [Pyricularia oryzae]|nr:hypothetical protein MCOR19_004838 [Pyricularia oryzae]KAI6284729.1 hypothetical protein MCOR26_001852 [Pyricularia oryzae]KAI6302769.1 hypothetical protein MCOR29_010754 [Pyricularia oryzae]KAI6343618.1 hypothetical protein MCOR28_004704 [Pyricularia oryzae]KAI6433518.1 hypothetical protein MCOR21_002724 [Pyricularia oryzae]